MIFIHLNKIVTAVVLMLNNVQLHTKTTAAANANNANTSMKTLRDEMPKDTKPERRPQ